MPDTDNAAPADEQDKPDTDSAPEDSGTSADVDNWKQSYEELRSKFNERDQEVAQLRSFRESLADPARQAEILKDYGIHLADDEPDEDLEDDVFRDPRVDQLLQEREQEREQQQQQQAYEGFVADTVEQTEALEEQLGEEFTDEEFDLLLDLRETAARRGENVPVKDIYEKRLSSVYETRRQKYVTSKKNAPQVSKVGRSATDDSNRLDVDDRAERVRRMTERFQMAQQQS